MNTTNLFFRFGVALFIGILVGLQREFARKDENRELSAGIRTFGLMGLFGCSGAFITNILNSPWPFVGIFIVFGFLLSVNYFIQAWNGQMGLTTETAAVLTVLAGALCFWGQIEVAVAIGVITTVILSAKLEMHQFAATITKDDIFSTLKFAVITAIILPILPNKNFGPEPFNLFNPYSIWLLVVLISAISFVGYVLIKIIGPSKGIGLTGLLGGLASSTAVTLNFTQRSITNPELSKPFALAIILAWSIMYPRVFIIVLALNSHLAQRLLIPMGVLGLIGLAYCGYLYYTIHARKSKEQVAFVNPFELGPAIKFGALFSFILLASKAATIYLGDTGLYLASLLSGFADVDAISLSVTKLANDSSVTFFSTATRAIIIASIANTLAKGGIVLVSGSKSLKKQVLPVFALLLITAMILILLA